MRSILRFNNPALFALGTIALAGCEVWLDVDTKQCTDNSACVRLLGSGATCNVSGICERASVSDGGDNRPELPSRWACVREDTPDFVPDSSRKLRLRLSVVDVSDTTKVPEGLVARSCAPADVLCANPFEKDVKPGDDGYLQFDALPYGFEGYVEIDAPGYVPGISYDSRPYLTNVQTSGPAIVTPDILKLIELAAGTESSESSGLIFLEVRDCADGPGDGVSFDMVEDKSPFYFDGSLPSNTLTATTVSNMLGQGGERRAIGGFANIPAHLTTFTARLPDTGDMVSRITVLIRAGEITYVRMRAGY